MAEMVKICNGTCEGVDFDLYSNGDENRYQTLKMTRRVPNGKSRVVMIAPVDFFTVSSAIMCEDMLCNMVDKFGDTWSAERFESALEEIFEGE